MTNVRCSDPYLSAKGHHVMFTEGEDVNILDNHQFVMVLVEDCPIHQVPDVLLVALGEVKHGLGISLGGLAKTLTFRILADTFQNRPYGACQLLDPFLSLLG